MHSAFVVLPKHPTFYAAVFQQQIKNVVKHQAAFVDGFGVKAGMQNCGSEIPVGQEFPVG